MARFSSFLSAYRKLDTLARREKDRSEYYDDRAFWVGLGIAATVALGLLSLFFTADVQTSLLCTSMSSAITIPVGRKIANYFWTRKVERFSNRDRYLDHEKLVEEELRREIARIRSLNLIGKEATPLLIDAYRESVRKRKSYLRTERSRHISDPRPEVWNYVPSETRKIKDRLLKQEKARQEKRELEKTIRTERENERIAREIKKLEGGS